MLSNPEFSERYARERETQANFLAAQVVEIADTVREGKKVRVRRGWVITEHGDMVDRSRRLRVF